MFLVPTTKGDTTLSLGSRCGLTTKLLRLSATLLVVFLYFVCCAKAELRAIVSMHAGLRMGSDEEDQADSQILCLEAAVDLRNQPLARLRWCLSPMMTKSLASFSHCNRIPSLRRVW